MTTTPSRGRLVAAATASVTAATVVLLSSPAAAAPPDDAAAYLVSQLTDGDHYEIDGGPQYGPTIDFAIGLLAAGGQQAFVDAMGAYLTTDSSVSAYVHEDDPAEIYAGAVGKLGFLASLTGADPYDVGGEDLIATLQGLEGADGRFSDVSKYGDYSNTFTQAFAVLSLTAAAGAEPSEASVQLLLDAQCHDGSFALGFTGGKCTGTADSTGIVLQALNGVDPDESDELSPERVAAVTAAAGWLVDNRQPDGSFLLGGTVNINSTGYGGLGLAAAGLDSTSTADFLSSVQLPDGGLPLAPGMESDAYATAQALPALSADSLLSLDPAVLAPGVVVEPSPTPTATPSQTPTTTPTQSPTGTPSTSAPEPTASTSELPATGASAATLAAVAGGLLLLGAAAVLLARRSLRRP